MEFDFVIRRETLLDPDDYLIMEGNQLPPKAKANKNIVKLIDEIGQASSKVKCQKISIFSQ
jgi:hypothetical protein